MQPFTTSSSHSTFVNNLTEPLIGQPQPASATPENLLPDVSSEERETNALLPATILEPYDGDRQILTDGSGSTGAADYSQLEYTQLEVHGKGEVSSARAEEVISPRAFEYCYGRILCKCPDLKKSSRKILPPCTNR